MKRARTPCVGGVGVGGEVEDATRAHVFLGGCPHPREELLQWSAVRPLAAAFTGGGPSLRAVAARSRAVGKLSTPRFLQDNLWWKAEHLRAARASGAVRFVHIKARRIRAAASQEDLRRKIRVIFTMTDSTGQLKNKKQKKS